MHDRARILNERNKKAKIGQISKGESSSFQTYKFVIVLQFFCHKSVARNVSKYSIQFLMGEAGWSPREGAKRIVGLIGCLQDRNPLFWFHKRCRCQKAFKLVGRCGSS